MKFELVGHPTSPAVAWKRLADTDYMNRLAGNGKIVMGSATEEGGRMVYRGTSAGPLGTTFGFVERHTAWAHQRWFFQSREWTGAPMSSTEFELSLRPAGDGLVVPRIGFEIKPRTPLFRPLLAPSVGKMQTGWQHALDALPTRDRAPAPMEDRQLPDGVRNAASRWDAPPVVRERMVELLATAPATQLQRIRPFELADQWGEDRTETLATLIRAVPAGLLELYWSVRCPRCKGEVGTAKILSDVASHAECRSCLLDFDADMSSNVEVRFAPHEGLLPRVEESFCSIFPAGAPEIMLVVPLAAGEERVEELSLPPGRFTVGGGKSSGDLELFVGDGEVDEVTWAPGSAGRITVGKKLRLRFRAGERPERVVVVRDDDDLAAPARLVSQLPEFARSLGSEVLAKGVSLTSRRITLLFTDLSGSTAMYEAVGDAPAFAFVRDHFRLVEAVVAEHGGEVVKTIGDAVMASFPDPASAVTSALVMSAKFDRWALTRGIAPVPRINIGVHVGPALVVVRDGLDPDYFGRTVNIAARVQGQAQDGAIVWSPEVHAEEAVQSVVVGREVTSFQAHLKGVGERTLYRLV